MATFETDAPAPAIVTLDDAERAYREQWHPLGELAVRTLHEFTGGDLAKFIKIVRRSLAAPPEAFAAFYQSAMRDAIARGLPPPGASGWVGQPTDNREAN
jgi:hypothetical protein